MGFVNLSTVEKSLAPSPRSPSGSPRLTDHDHPVGKPGLGGKPVLDTNTKSLFCHLSFLSHTSTSSAIVDLGLKHYSSTSGHHVAEAISAAQAPSCLNFLDIHNLDKVTFFEFGTEVCSNGTIQHSTDRRRRSFGQHFQQSVSGGSSRTMGENSRDN